MATRSFNVLQFVDTAQLKRDLAYSTADLANARTQQSSFLAHYGELAAKASKQVDDLKLLLEVGEAKAYRTLRDEAVSKGEKVTEALLEKLVIGEPRVIAFKKALNEAKQIEANAKTAVEAFRHRKDMIVQQGADDREEFKSEAAMTAISARVGSETAIARQGERVLERLQQLDNQGPRP